MVMSEMFINKEMLIRLLMECPSSDISELVVHSIFQTHGRNVNLNEE